MFTNGMLGLHNRHATVCNAQMFTILYARLTQPEGIKQSKQGVMSFSTNQNPAYHVSGSAWAVT